MTCTCRALCWLAHCQPAHSGGNYRQLPATPGQVSGATVANSYALLIDAVSCYLLAVANGTGNVYKLLMM